MREGALLGRARAREREGETSATLVKERVATNHNLQVRLRLRLRRTGMGNGLRSVQLGLGTETGVSGSVGLLEAFQAGLVYRRSRFACTAVDSKCAVRNSSCRRSSSSSNASTGARARARGFATQSGRHVSCRLQQATPARRQQAEITLSVVSCAPNECVKAEVQQATVTVLVPQD